MNLMKLFNFKYFYQNIRKSRGILLFLMTIVPMITGFMLFLSLINHQYLIDFNYLSMISLVGAIIIPVVLSFSLFGFILSKKKIDFYLAQPISRKSIYWTNILGGIITIIIYLIITVFIYYLFSLLTSLIIPLKLLIDYFLYWLIAYLFMFIITTLAISISGNVLTSLVIMALIIFLYPFISFVKIANIYDSNYYFECNNDECLYTDEEGETNRYSIINLSKETLDTYTIPVDYFINEANYKTITKTFILSIIYLIIGYMAFTKRKMENNECSFKNNFIYFLVKTLTFLPICYLAFIIVMVNSIIYLFIGLLIAIIYYIVYDLLVRREIVKLRLTIPIFVCTFTLYYILFSCLYFSYTNKEYKFNHIDELLITNYANYEEIVIKDQHLINEIIKNRNIYKNSGSYENITLTIDNAKYATLVYLNNEVRADILAYAKKNNILSNNETFPINKTDYIYYSDQVKIPVTKSILENIKKDNNSNLEKNNEFILILYYYDNFEYKDIEVSVVKNSDLQKYLIKELNHSFINNIDYDNLYHLADLRYNFDEAKYKYNNSTLPNSIIIENYQDFIKLLKDHQDDEITNNYYTIVSFKDCDYNYYIDASVLESKWDNYEEEYIKKRLENNN